MGFEGIIVTSKGANFIDHLPDIPPCNIEITGIVTALPFLQGTEAAGSQLEFIDQNGNGWQLSGRGKLTPVAVNPNTEEFAGAAPSELEPVAGGCPSS